MKNWLSNSNLLRILALCWLAVVSASCIYLFHSVFVQANFKLETNVLALLPENRQDPVAQKAFDKLADSFDNKVVFVLSGSDKKQLYRSAEQLSANLNSWPEFGSVIARLSERQQESWASFYYSKRQQLLSPEQRTLLENQPELLVQNVFQSVYNPFSGVTGTELKKDPFLLFRDYISYISSLSGKFKLDEGYLVQDVKGVRYLMVVADLAISPYSLAAQNKVSEILQLEQTLFDKYDVTVIHTGALFYAAFGTESAKSEISTIGIGSLVGVVLLFWFIYRSVLPLTLALVSIFSGIVVALSGTVALFGQIHIFSLVFGASLIGVSIDYSFHFLTERLVAGADWNAGTALKHIITAITLGLVTSLIGYLGLLVAPFPGLQQLAAFSTIGLVASYLTVVLWYPELAKRSSGLSRLPGRKLFELWLEVWRVKAFQVVFPSVITFIALLLCLNVSYNDDVRLLQALPKELKQQEQFIQTLTGLSGSQQMLLVAGKDEQALLRELEGLAIELDKLISEKYIDGYYSIHQYIPSLEMQQENYRLISKLYNTQSEALIAALSMSGEPFQLDPFMPVTLSEYFDSSASDTVKPLYLGDIDGQTYALISLKGVSSVQEVKKWSESKQHVTYLNKADEISVLFAEYRWNVSVLLGIALLAILLILSWRYSVAQGVLMVLPPVIASLCAIAITAFTGQSVNLFNLLAIILILGIGIDYTLFFAEQKQSKSTLLAISLSALTTIFSFGLLAMSNTHAIHSFGVTILTGIIVCWLLSPLALIRVIK